MVKKISKFALTMTADAGEIMSAVLDEVKVTDDSHFPH